MEFKTLQDFLPLFNEHIKGEDINKVALDAKVSISTVYNYFKGEIVKITVANSIMESGKKLLTEKGISY